MCLQLSQPVCNVRVTHASCPPTPQASKGRRKKLLEWFRDRFAPSSRLHECELLESECGGASLFLARVLVWMHKTVSSAKCFALSEQLACVQIFLTSPNVHVYYREFQQGDGLSLLIKVLGIENPQGSAVVLVSDADRIVIMELLLRISQRGRTHKEEFSRCNGEIAVIRGALAGTERCGASGMVKASPLWDACRDALLEQMVGNPKSVEQVHGAIVFMLQHEEEKELQVFGAQVRTLSLLKSAFSTSGYRFPSTEAQPCVCSLDSAAPHHARLVLLGPVVPTRQGARAYPTCDGDSPVE